MTFKKNGYLAHIANHYELKRRANKKECSDTNVMTVVASFAQNVVRKNYQQASGSSTVAGNKHSLNSQRSMAKVMCG